MLWCDRAAVALAVMASIGALFWPLVRASSGSVGLCVPFGAIDYEGGSIVLADADRLRVRIGAGSGGCVVNGSTAECKLTNASAVGLVKALVDSESGGDGATACRAVREMADAIGLVVDETRFEYWRVVYAGVTERYYRAFEKAEEELRVDEIAAVTMPLLLPPAVIALRVLFG
jgi:hypothetical protein